MESLARTLNRSVRTIQRHLHLLRELGLIEFVERRRYKGRFSSYLYRVLHIIQTTGHGKPVEGKRSNRRRTKQVSNTPKSPSSEAFNWFFGKERNLQAEEEHQNRREEESRRRTEGYSWFFK